MNEILFQTINWEKIPVKEFSGESGIAFWQTIDFKGLRIRLVEYSNNYTADHWCEKGHIVYCIEGEFYSLLDNGETYHITQGMSYVVSDNMSVHRSYSKTGVKLLIIDGDFLR